MSGHTFEDHSVTAWSYPADGVPVWLTRDHATRRKVERVSVAARLRAWLFSAPAEGYLWERKR